MKIHLKGDPERIRKALEQILDWQEKQPMRILEQIRHKYQQRRQQVDRRSPWSWLQSLRLIHRARVAERRQLLLELDEDLAFLRESMNEQLGAKVDRALKAIGEVRQSLQALHEKNDPQ